MPIFMPTCNRRVSYYDETEQRTKTRECGKEAVSHVMLFKGETLTPTAGYRCLEHKPDDADVSTVAGEMG